ncbi:MAG: TPM domain-containing protein [Clostridia bacterium]|nr:TPM domain-containing protein [Clostridia bacterium]
MKKIFASILSAFVLIAMFSANAFAAVPEPGEDFYYLDQVGVMSAETKSLLYTNGEALKNACGAQIVVCVVDSFGKMSAKDFAYELINKWGVGDKKKQNGVALVIAEGDGEYRMVIGTGLERYMDGSDVQDLLDRYFHPYFKEYETDKGIQALYGPLFKKITSVYDVNVPLITGSELPGEIIIYDEPEESFFDFDMVVSLVVLLIIISVVANAKRRSRVYGGGHRPVIIFSRPHFGGHHHHGGHRPSGGSFGGSRSSGRSGGFGGARGGGGGSRGVGGGGRR